jgi:hypothetical protein
MDWDSPPTYDDDASEVDPNERPLPFDLEEEYEEDGSSPMFGGLCHKDDIPLEEEEPTDNITDYEEVDEDLPGEVPNFSDEELGYVDFLAIDDIFLDSHNNDCDECFVDEENYDQCQILYI